MTLLRRKDDSCTLARLNHQTLILAGGYSLRLTEDYQESSPSGRPVHRRLMPRFRMSSYGDRYKGAEECRE